MLYFGIYSLLIKSFLLKVGPTIEVSIHNELSNGGEGTCRNSKSFSSIGDESVGGAGASTKSLGKDSGCDNLERGGGESGSRASDCVDGDGDGLEQLLSAEAVGRMAGRYETQM